jgi:hypothetical protein
MKKVLLTLLLGAASCTTLSMRPTATERTGAGPDYIEMMSANFEVSWVVDLRARVGPR